MPRKYWPLKNRYCWNSNLSERMFLALLRLYCTGYTCTRAAKILARYARCCGEKKISRQTVNRYYRMLGDYLYEQLPDEFQVENFPLKAGDDVPEDETERQLYTANIIIVALHRILYEKLTWNDPVNQILINRKTELVHDMMRAFSKSKRGYSLRTFNAHLAYAFWSVLVPNLIPEQPVWKGLYIIMKKTLEVEPMDVRTQRSLRIESP